MSGRDSRRKQLERRIREDLKDKLPEDLFEAQKIVDEAVSERVRTTGADNFSRIVGELEKCGYIARYYEGYRTPPPNRGRSEEHTSEIPSLMRNSYAVFCL